MKKTEIVIGIRTSVRIQDLESFQLQCLTGLYLEEPCLS